MKKNKTLKMLLIVMIFAVIACTTLVACEEKVTVTFMDGENVLSTVEIEKDSAITLPTNPTKGGYSFVGWYVDAELTQAYDAEVVTSVSSNVTLYAKFEKIKLYISVVTNGGTITIDGQEQNERGVVEVSNGGQYTLPTPTKEGYTFAGYTLDGEDFAISGTYARENSITVRAQWELNAYVVSYFDGSNKLADVNVNHGSKVVYSGAGSSLIKTGYTFAGWYTDAELTNAYDENTLVTGNFNLYAKFSANSYVINVNANGGDAVNAVNVVYGGEYTIPTPTRTGYTFAGYTLDGDEFALTGTYDKASNVTVRAQWTLNVYNVTIDGNSQNVNHGGKVVLPTAPVGHTFAGLYTDAEFNTAFDKDTAVTGDLTLYAKYTANAYVINVNVNGGDAMPAVNVVYGGAYTISVPNRTGYTFAGYTFDGETFELSGTYNRLGNITITAQWTLNSYVVTIDGDEQNVNHGSKVVLPTAPVGHTFAGLYTDAEFNTAFDKDTAVTGDLTLYAKYTANPYVINVVLVRNDASLEGGVTIDVVFGEEYSVADPTTTNANYEFVKYTYGGVEFNQEGTYNYATDITIVAEWTTVEGYYNLDVVFMNGNQTVVSFEIERIDDTAVVIDPTLIPEDPTKVGYTFSHWSLTENGTAVDLTVAIDSSKVYYACYTVNNYTIGFDASLTEEYYVNGITVAYGASYAITAPTKDGYTFIGWTIEDEEGYVNANGVYEYEYDIVLIPEWQINTYDVKLFIDGTLFDTIEDVEYGAIVAEPVISETKEGHSLDGWYTTQAYATKYVFGNTMGTGDIYLYARFVVNSYTISFVGGIKEDIVLNYGAGYAITAPSKTGYTFMGWVVVDTDNPFEASGVYNVADNVTLDAVWQINSYDVEVYVDGELRDVMVIDYGDVITVPTISAKNAGYTLDGWYTNSACTAEYDFDTLVTKEFSIYAKNVANTYTITVNASDVEVVNAIAPIEVTYEQPYSVGDLVATNANYVFNGYTLYGNEFAQSGIYNHATNIEIVAVWQAEDVSSDLFVADEVNGYFKERDSVNELFTYVFLVGNTYNFNVESIVFPDGIPSVYVNQTELYGTSFTALKAGEFTMTVNKADAEPVVYDVKVVDKVNYFSAGTDYNNAWGVSYNRTSFRNQDKGTLTAGNENFIPDLVARDVNSNSIAYSAINVDLIEAIDSESNDISSDISEVDGVFTLDSTLVGKTITLSFRPRYTFIDDTVSMTFVVNNGVNVYNNAELKKAYGDLAVREINVLRNIKAELSATDYVNNDPNTGAPKNGGYYSRGYEHGVYTRLATTAGDTLKVNGNFFTVDGTDLPYIDNTIDGGGNNVEAWEVIANNYIVAFVQIGIFLYYSAPTELEACAAGGHVDNNGDNYCDHASCKGSMMRLSRENKYHNSTLTIDNLNVKGNYDTARSNEVRTVAGKTSNGTAKDGSLITMSASMLGIVNRGGTINMDNVTVTNTLSAMFSESTAATNDGNHDVQWNVKDCILKDSWHANSYVYGLTKIDFQNTYMGGCNGAILHYDDRAWNNAAWTNQYNSILTVDENCVFENYITGDEAWFVAFGQSSTATTLKTQLEATVGEIDAGINAQINGTAGIDQLKAYLGITTSTYIDKSIIHSKKTGIGEDSSTVDTINFILVVRSADYDGGNSTDWTYEGAGDTEFDMSSMPMIEHNIPTYFTIDLAAGGIGSTFNYTSNFIPFMQPIPTGSGDDFNKIMSGIVLGRDATINYVPTILEAAAQMG